MSKNRNPETVVREIKGKTHRKFSAEEKIRIVLEGLRGEETIAELCRREGISPNLYYNWSKEFLEAGKRRLLGDTKRQADSTEVRHLRQENPCSAGHIISERIVYRILKDFGLLTSPAYIVMSPTALARIIHEP